MLFDDLMQSKKMKDPEIRKPGEIRRAEGNVNDYRRKRTSVSAETFRISLFVVGALLTVGIIAAVGYFGWKAFEIYIGG